MPLGRDEKTQPTSAKEEKKFDVSLQMESKYSALDLKIAASEVNSGLPFIDKLPEDILLESVLSQLSLESDLKTASALANVSTKSHHLFQSDLNNLKINKLLQHIARGEEHQASKLIASNPQLLLQRGTVKDYSGNTIENVTPFELAYGGDDDDMCKMMLPYIDKIPNGIKEISKQIRTRFPESKEEKTYDFSTLVAAITTNTNVETALEKFREDFKPRVIKKGKHFNVQALTDALQIYINNYDPWSAEQCSLFWRQVIGYLQSMLPTCYAQALCQGLFNLTEGKQPLKRSLKLKDEIAFYSSNPSSRSGLGFDSGVYSYGMAWGCNVAWLISARRHHKAFSNLVSNKNSNMAKLVKCLSYQLESCCFTPILSMMRSIQCR